MINSDIKDPSHYYFDNANKHADWKEKLGYFFLKPLHYTEGYTKVSFDNNLNCQKIAGKTSRLALFIFRFLNFLGIDKLGKSLLNFSASHKKQYSKLRFKINSLGPSNIHDGLISRGQSIQKGSLCVPGINATSYVLKPSELTAFYKTVDQWSFLEGIMEEYQNAIHSNNPLWTNKKASAFLYNELLSIQNNMKKLVKDAEKVIELFDKKVDCLQVDVNELCQLHGLIENSKKLKTNYQSLLQILKARLDDGTQREVVIGLENDGNTCYINSSLQPLLAVKNFNHLVPKEIFKNSNESDEAFAGRKNILKAFKAVLRAWNDKSPPGELGHLIGKMRSMIFQVGLLEGGFIDTEAEHSFQDAGSFFELILHVIGQGFQLNSIKKFQLPNGSHKIVGGTNPQSVLLLKETKGSIQDKINAFAKVVDDELAPQYAVKHTDPKTQELLKLTKFTEENKIIGSPQELLVIRVENHIVDPEKDGLINCAGLFNSTLNPDAANYELTGFAQNHNQVHWTSVVYSNGVWKHCNDSHVSTVEVNDASFKYPANYLVYKKKH